jgi:hypothetical protein
MPDGEEYEVRSTGSRWRFRFSLLALFVFITLICLSLAWLVKPRRFVAKALFEVSSTTSDYLGGIVDEKFNEQQFEIFKKTQLAKLKSNYVLTAALRSPSVGALPIFQGRSDPVDWLMETLDVSFPENGEVLSISLHGTESQTPDLIMVVDAVAKAYRDEVIAAERQRRATNRDLVDRNLDNLNSDIKRKMDEYLAITEESGRAEGGGEVLQQLDTKRLDRVDDEIIRLESDLAANPTGDEAKRKSIAQRISQLRDRQAELEKRITTRAEKSTDLETRRRELEQLQRIADEMSLKLEQLDAEATAPDRIRQIQAAVASPE